MSALVSAAKRGVIGPSAGMLGVGGAAAGALIGNRSPEKDKGMFIHDGYMAVRTRLGRAVIRRNGEPVVKGPGFSPHIPGTHANKWISTLGREV